MDVPEHLRCPITLTAYEDPVVAADGATYERHAIEKWLVGSSRSPTTNVEMGPTLLPNRDKRAQVTEWRERGPTGTLGQALGAALMTGDAAQLKRQVSALADLDEPPPASRLRLASQAAGLDLEDALVALERREKELLPGRRRALGLARAAVPIAQKRLDDATAELERTRRELERHLTCAGRLMRRAGTLERECRAAGRVRDRYKAEAERHKDVGSSAAPRGGDLVSEALDLLMRSDFPDDRVHAEVLTRVAAAAGHKAALALARDEGWGGAGDDDVHMWMAARAGTSLAIRTRQALEDGDETMLECLADNGCPVAAHHVAGTLCEDEAEPYLVSAAAEGHIRACDSLAHLYDRRGADAEAVDMWQRAADAGHVSAMYNVAECYNEGTGTNVAPARARTWHGHAAARDCLDSLWEHGNMCLKGQGGPVDFRSGLRHIVRAAFLGQADAREVVGLARPAQ